MDRELEVLKQRYEYLDFDSLEVKNCFLNAKNNTLNNENEYTYKMSLNDNFIVELLKLIDQGRKDVYDALQIGYEKEYNFYLLKKKLVKSAYTNKVFDIAFAQTIVNYDGSYFASMLIKNMNVLIKLGEEELDNMKYNLKSETIYEVFKQYDSSILDVILKVMKIKEPSSYHKLVNYYGEDFKKRSTKYFDYYSLLSIENILRRIESKLEFSETLLNEGKNLKYINDLFMKLNDTKLLELMSEKKKSKNDSVVLKNKKQIMEKYHVNEKELDGGIDFIDNSNARLAFKYAYGIGVKKLEIKNILEMLKITQNEYDQLILYVFNNLIKCIDEYREYIKNLEPVKVEKTKVEKITKVDKKAKVKINKTKKITNFFDGLFSENVSEEERKQLEEKILEYIKNSNSESAKNALKLYGDNLKHYDETVKLSKTEKANIRSFRLEIKKKVQTGKLITVKEKKVQVKKEVRIKTFYDNLLSEDMNEEERKQLEGKILEYIKNSESESAKNALKLYGEDLKHYDEIIELTRKEKTNISCLKNAIKKKIQMGTLEIKVDKKVKEKKEVKIKTFYDNMLLEDMSEEERKQLEEKILEYVKNSNSESAKNALKLYGKDLKHYDETVELNDLEKTNIRSLRSYIKKQLQNGQFGKKKKSIKSKKNKTFYDNLLSEDMNEEERKQLEEKILEYIKNSESESAKNALKLYGKDLKHYDETVELTKKEKVNISCLKNFLKKKINDGFLINQNQPKKKKAREVKNRTFFDTIIDSSLGKEEQEKQRLKIIEYVRNLNTLSATCSFKLYGENLDCFNNNNELSRNEKQLVNWLINKIKVKIANGTLNDISRGRKRAKYFYQRFVDDFSIEESDRIKRLLLQIIDKYRDEDGFMVAVKLYGDNLNESLHEIKLSANEKSIYNSFVAKVKKELKKLLCTQEKNQENEIEPVSESIIYEEKITTYDKLSYIEEIIYQLYEKQYGVKSIANMLLINENYVASTLIGLLDRLEDKTSLIYEIINEYPSQIIELFQSNYLEQGLSSCTKIEKEILYLKMLSVSNPLITDEFICSIIGVGSEELNGYELMTKNDEINKLGQEILSKKKML